MAQIFPYLPTVAPSILAADPINLKAFINQCIKCESNLWLHCDIMDAHFVPNLSFGPHTIKAIRTQFKHIFLDVHLMLERPDRYIDTFAQSGADLISFHIEANSNPQETIKRCKKLDIKVGICIKPHTDIHDLIPLLKNLDIVTVMSVEPGFSGQSFIELSHKKIAWLKTYRQKNQLRFLIQVDGGITLSHIKFLVTSGADILTIGSSIFNTHKEVILDKLLIRLHQ